MKILTPTRWPYAALVLSAGLLIGAWVFQYGLGYAPCQMCFWQRHAHKFVIGLALLSIIMNMTQTGAPRFWLSLIGLALLGSFALAFWHVGVEYKWWEGPKSCMGTANLDVIDPSKLLDSLDDPVKLPACSDAVWHFLGLSMAGWNAILSLAGAVMTGLAMKGTTHA